MYGNRSLTYQQAAAGDCLLGLVIIAGGTARLPLGEKMTLRPQGSRTFRNGAAAGAARAGRARRRRGPRGTAPPAPPPPPGPSSLFAALLPPEADLAAVCFAAPRASKLQGIPLQSGCRGPQKHRPHQAQACQHQGLSEEPPSPAPLLAWTAPSGPPRSAAARAAGNTACGFSTSSTTTSPGGTPGTPA
eukprot:CAMPEP_0194665648 /NCGR_PEP_ID=MMETSP0295-20121207/2230_1 /TAXON_ID=39354 /ORGANISM="Heterosigma akashiwo, Strain CCMP2393" /LENGTH=188 /DNA_ID=CAMNT_0039547717 /DNA_START=373 /DNA_END=935 /DNA_ORIENTATION=-